MFLISTLKYGIEPRTTIRHILLIMQKQRNKQTMARTRPVTNECQSSIVQCFDSTQRTRFHRIFFCRFCRLFSPNNVARRVLKLFKNSRNEKKTSLSFFCGETVKQITHKLLGYLTRPLAQFCLECAVFLSLSHHCEKFQADYVLKQKRDDFLFHYWTANLMRNVRRTGWSLVNAFTQAVTNARPVTFQKGLGPTLMSVTAGSTYDNNNDSLLSTPGQHSI